jgi:hypothetical protein
MLTAYKNHSPRPDIRQARLNIMDQLLAMFTSRIMPTNEGEAAA